MLDVTALSRATGLAEEEVRTLLDGGELPVPDEELEAMVRQRVQFLYETNTGADGQPQDLRELAAELGQTTTWVKKLVAGEAKPNLVVGHALCRHYRVAASFLTDRPEEALNRELQPVLLDLEIEADPEQALRDLNVRSISGRSAMPEKLDMSDLARMVANIAQDLDVVMKRLETPEENR
ncbi:hypothetical protein QJ054_33740 [Streptomyces sp. AN-3]|uniref:hypothetical protein n=1 Tax=Streptomyces sp. AN-3 TaxID=3044177 RepID=UPI00249BBF97|nr:hypothetical protein [Streptomyces sp. AN-3]MDI3102000.1 hypothetical protein [Streptomyces sp. AN-3]MDV6291228.1 hypothetical protein [Streptomyces sp. UP1A-1]